MPNANDYFVQWLDLTLPGGNNGSNVLDFSFNLGTEGGQFSVLSDASLGGLGAAVEIFGLGGTITRSGKKSSNNAYGFLTKGIFGSDKLNKEFNIINYGNQHYIQYVGTQILYPLNVQPDQQMTVSDMVRNILIASGAHGGFYVVDAPYTDVLSQSGQTGLEALASLAAQVGGQLRWSGGDNYNIVYPNHTAGTFTIPDSRLLTAEGTEFEQILDLGLGVTGTGVLQIPKANIYPSENEVLPDTPIEIIEKKYSITKKLTENDPPELFDLPVDTFSIKLQILVTPENFSEVISGVHLGVTTDPNTWADLGGLSITNPYVEMGTFWNSHNPKGKVDHTLFPDIPAVNNGHFTLSIGITRASSLADAFLAQQEDATNKQKDLINRMLANLRFIKTYEGTINCFFFGSIPLPGMWASATNICGETVSGIIESVSFNHPGILTIQVAQYLRVNFLDAKDNFVSNPLNLVI